MEDKSNKTLPGFSKVEIKREVSPVVCCAQLEWTIPEFTMFVRMKQRNISRYLRSLRTPDVVWQLSIDTNANEDEQKNVPTEIYFKLFLKSGLAKLSRKDTKRWDDVNVVLRINSGETPLTDAVLSTYLSVNHNENELAEFSPWLCRKTRDINKVLVDGTLTLTCSVNYCVLDEIYIEKYEPGGCQLMPFPLSEVLHNGLLSECVVIKVGERCYNCHKGILGFYSSVFQSMFEHQMNESETGVVSITDHSVEAIGDLLAYMYTGQVENGDNIEELFEVADKYNVSHLKNICEQMLIKKLSIENVCHFLVLADLHSGNDLKMACFEFFVENRKKILQTNEWKTLKRTFVDLTNSVLEWMCNSN